MIQEFDLTATWKTARARQTPSKPLLWLLEHGHLTHQQMILDWGCGKAKDVDFLANQLGWRAVGYDPNIPSELFSTLNQKLVLTNSFPPIVRSSGGPISLHWDGVVTCTYVLNVLPPDLAQELLEQILGIGSLHRAFFTVRRDLAGSGYTGSGSYQSPHLWLDDRSDLEQIHSCSSFAIYSSLEKGI